MKMNKIRSQITADSENELDIKIKEARDRGWSLAIVGKKRKNEKIKYFAIMQKGE